MASELTNPIAEFDRAHSDYLFWKKQSVLREARRAELERQSSYGYELSPDDYDWAELTGRYSYDVE